MRLLFAFIACGLALWALYRAHKLQSWARTCEERLDEAEARLQRVEAAKDVAAHHPSPLATRPAPAFTQEPTLHTPPAPVPFPSPPAPDTSLPTPALNEPTAPRAPVGLAPQFTPPQNNHQTVAQPTTRDWEQWVGVRGAAVVAGMMLALAAIYLVQYAAEHAYLSPTVRLALGTSTGLVALGAGLALSRDRYAMAADALVGAGLVGQYAVLWAGYALYDLLSLWLSFVGMTVVTACAGYLSVRRASKLVACLGLAGGFVTPLLLTTGDPSPFVLFGYIFLLDAGLLLLARYLWPPLAVVSLLATALYQMFWLGWKMGPSEESLGFALLAASALLYAGLSPRGASASDVSWRVSRVGSLGVSLALAATACALHEGDLGQVLLPLGGLLLLLTGLAGFMARAPQLGLPWLPTALGSVSGLLFLQLWRQIDCNPSPVWTLVATIAAVAGLHGAFVLWERRVATGARVELGATACVSLGAVALVLLSTRLPAPCWPCLWAWAVLAFFGHFVAARMEPWVHRSLAVGFGLAMAQVAWKSGTPTPMSTWDGYMGFLLLTGCVWQGRAWLRQGPRTDGDAALFSAALLLGLSLTRSMPPTSMALGLGLATLMALAALGAWAAVRGQWSRCAFAVNAGTALAQWRLVSLYPPANEDVWIACGLQAATVVFLTAWVFITTRADCKPGAIRSAALAAPLGFFGMYYVVHACFGEPHTAWVAAFYAVVSLAATARAHKTWAHNIDLQQTALAWFGAAALGSISLTCTLALSHEWLTLALALEGLGVTLLWLRVDRVGLKYFALALFVCVALRLDANSALLGYHIRSGIPGLNWLLYTYWVPAACMIYAAAKYAVYEPGRATAWEQKFLGDVMTPASFTCGALAGVTVFVWINLTIADLFAEGTRLSWPSGHQPARDLTTSVAWAVYAVSILALGVWRMSAGLRWASLGLLMFTVGKVFLYDLGELHDLYRVASLVGLALSLLGVSMSYQRFVFRK